MRTFPLTISLLSAGFALLLSGVAVAQDAPVTDTPPAADPGAPAEQPAPGQPAPGQPAPAQPVPDAPAEGQQPGTPPAEEAPPVAEQPTEAPPPEPPPPAVPPQMQPPPDPVAPAEPLQVSPEADAGVESKGRPEMTLAPELFLGAVGRLDSPSTGYDSAGGAGVLAGAGLYFAPNRLFAFGLSYQRAAGGTEQFSPGPTTTISGDVFRTFHTALVTARGYPLRSDTIGLWAGLSCGATWQNAHATGAIHTGEFPGLPQSYAVDGGPDAGLALGAGLGFDLDLDDNVAMLTSLNFMHHVLSSDPMSGTENVIVPGAGSTTQMDFRIAFQYRFDVSGAEPPASVQVGQAF